MFGGCQIVIKPMTQAEQIKELQSKFKKLEKRIADLERRLKNREPKERTENWRDENEVYP